MDSSRKPLLRLLLKLNQNWEPTPTASEESRSKRTDIHSCHPGLDGYIEKPHSFLYTQEAGAVLRNIMRGPIVISNFLAASFFNR